METLWQPTHTVMDLPGHILGGVTARSGYVPAHWGLSSVSLSPISLAGQCCGGGCRLRYHERPVCLQALPLGISFPVTCPVDLRCALDTEVAAGHILSLQQCELKIA